MLVHYFVPFIVSNRYLLFRDSNGHNSVTVQNRTHVYTNFFDHKDPGNHLLQLCPKVVKHPVYRHRRCGRICYILLQGTQKKVVILIFLHCFPFLDSYLLFDSAMRNGHHGRRSIIISFFLLYILHPFS